MLDAAILTQNRFLKAALLKEPGSFDQSTHYEVIGAIALALAWYHNDSKYLTEKSRPC